MVVSLRHLILSCCIFLAFQQVTDCVQCFYCDACSGNSNGWGSTSLSTNGAACFKYDYTSQPSPYVNRGVRAPCTPGSDGVGGTVYCCSTDNCNGSVTLSSSLSLLFALIIAIGVFKINIIN